MNNISAPPTSVHLAKDSLVVGEGSSLLAVAGEGVVLECKAEGGNPPPALRWSVGGSARDGAEEEIDSETGVTTSRLVLRVVRSDQGREVTCEAAHPALQHVLLATARLQVQCESEIEPLQKHKYFINYYLQMHPWSLFLLPLPPTSRGTQWSSPALWTRSPWPACSGIELAPATSCPASPC